MFTHVDTLVEEGAVVGIRVVAGLAAMLAGCSGGEGDGSGRIGRGVGRFIRVLTMCRNTKLFPTHNWD